MTDAIRGQILKVLEELGELAPELRFGQLVVNLSYAARGPFNESIWDVEDDELLAAAREHLQWFRNRAAASSPAVDLPASMPERTPLEK